MQFSIKPLYLLLALACSTTSTRAQWSAVGPSTLPSGDVWDMTADKAGNIYTIGTFQNSNGERYVAKWDGMSWSQLGGAGGGPVIRSSLSAIVADTMGNVYTGGQFGYSTSPDNNYVSHWNGTAWSKLGGFETSNYILTMATDGRNVYAAGDFHRPAALKGLSVMKWSGTAWSDIGDDTLLNGRITALATDKAGNVYAAGEIRRNSSEYIVAKWDGTAWTELGSANSAGPIYYLTVDATGHVCAVMETQSGYSYISRYNGTGWAAMGFGGQRILAIEADKVGNIYAAGNFTNATGYGYVAKWNGTAWGELGGTDALAVRHGNISTLAVTPNGDVYAGGELVAANNIALVARYRVPLSIASLPGGRAQLQIYPNPVNDKLYIADAPAGSSLTVRNATGMKVLVSSGHAADGISVQSLPAGLYWLDVVLSGAVKPNSVPFIKL